ncbi:MAG: energy-coupling factor transporter transmembrane protein EcfT [Anaerolineaceae bacterium]|nr:energy-coupling factor transporter transmembrane protein EcfT [Anaerolineaceae bacterium]
MTSEIFLDRDSIIHRLDARTKILVFLLNFVALVLFEHPLWIVPITTLIVLQVSLAGAWVNIWRIRFLFFVLILTGLVMWNIFASGETHLFWFVDLESLLYTITRVTLICMMIFSGVLLISTTRNEELVLGMIQLGLPYRVGFAISTSLRLVPTIASSIFTISQAQRSRGLDLESGNILERIKKYLPLLIPVFISTIRNTNVFGMALESKGFGARKERSFYPHPIMSNLDYFLVAFYIVVAVASIVFDVMGYGSIQGLSKF